MKKAAFLDIDGTLHNGFSNINFIYHLYEQGQIPKKDIEYLDHILNEDPRRHTHYNQWGYEVSAEINKLFAGRSKSALSDYLQSYREIIKQNLYEFTVPLLTSLRTRSYDLIFITGTHDFVAEVFADIFEVAYYNVMATRLAEKDGAFLDHSIAGFHMNQNDKRNHLENFKDTYDLSASVAVGDSEGDLKMLALVGKPFLLIDDKTVQSVIDRAKAINATVIDKNMPTEDVVAAFQQRI